MTRPFWDRNQRSSQLGRVIVLGSRSYDFSELICLTSVGGSFSISNCTHVTSLNGLNNLSSVGVALIIDNNEILPNLDGLSALASVGLEFGINYNEDLPDCEACDLLDQITSGPSSINVHDNLDDLCTPVPANCP